MLQVVVLILEAKDALLTSSAMSLQPHGSMATPSLSGPTATVTLSRYTVALHSVALHSVALRFPGFGGVSQQNRATPPERGLSHFKLPLGRYRGTRGFRSYTVACRTAVGP